MNKVVPVYRIKDAKTHVAYTKYVKEGNLPKTMKVDREKLREIMDVLCEQIAKGIIEHPGGAYIKNLGYFFNWKCPKKMTYHLNNKNGQEEHYNYHTDHYMYFPTFLPHASKQHIRSTWTMDKMFNNSLKKEVGKQIRSGFKYHNYIHTLKL